MNYTPEMEKAMQQSHKMGYAEYARNLDNQIAVEKKRQREYEQCKFLVADLENSVIK
ncbi:hypothetical protein JOC34_003065 [Virgibacillus halotolerans]|uniref:hypothetical protein n=1 Tax=Virgibacillus halotolerans TaxID=1071053 RepID=UPI0019617F61|nr:hypothetical protein [Virgibacillus halotolerans]MBM7600654.1 hypothetical protein [Virgibacillus halotolerans]